MKIFLTNRDVTVEGYKNIHVDSIDEVCDGECYQIYLDDLLINSFPILETHDRLNSWLRKVEVGGRIIIQGVDIDLFARDIVYDLLEKEQQQSILQSMRCSLTWKEVKEFVCGSGFDVVRVELNGCNFILEANRVS